MHGTVMEAKTIALIGAAEWTEFNTANTVKRGHRSSKLSKKNKTDAKKWMKKEMNIALD